MVQLSTFGFRVCMALDVLERAGMEEVLEAGDVSIVSFE